MLQVDSPAENIVVVRLQGRLDATTAPQVRSELTTLPQRSGPNMVVDLSEVTFIDSSGLSALVSALKAVRLHEGALVLVGPNEQVRMALRLTMLDRVFRVFTNVEEALHALQEGT